MRPGDPDTFGAGDGVGSPIVGTLVASGAFPSVMEHPVATMRDIANTEERRRRFTEGGSVEASGLDGSHRSPAWQGRGDSRRPEEGADYG
jgi:hypothetical protein